MVATRQPVAYEWAATDASPRPRGSEPWRVVLIVESCVAALIAGYAMYYGAQTHAVARGAGLITLLRVQVHNDAKPWWLAAGLTEALAIVVAIAVGAKLPRNS
jgi:4-hydroxybenzoate polyprenyltransferase